MKNQSKSDNKKQLTANILITLSLLLSVVSLGVGFYAINSLHDMGELETKYNTRIQAEHAKLKFCYERDLKPCDEISIKEWNETADPEDRFNLFYRG